MELHLSSDLKAFTALLSVRPDGLEPVRSANSPELLGESCAHSILEARLSLSQLGVHAAERVGLWLAVKRNGLMLQRLPASGALELSVPGADFERAHWKV